ncbi:MAG: Ku protein [Chloroflexi bacterium]|nr:Ku protein [Chloroflexota bacterium]
MARAFWKGAISFGMVVITVKMYVATESKTLSFNFLHKKCLTRPKQMWYCEKDDVYFTPAEMVKGYPYAKGQYVVLKESDFEKVPVRTTHTIEVFGFVDSQEIDPIYYYASHYLEPEELGVKPFALLREVLLKTRKIGLAKVSFQRREHLCALRPLGDILALHTMHYQDELRSPAELAPPAQKLKSQELEMAEALVAEMTKKFEPSAYKDEYRVALEKMLEARVEGGEIEAIEAPKIEAQDLMAALRKSIEAAREKSTARK